MSNVDKDREAAEAAFALAQAEWNQEHPYDRSNGRLMARWFFFEGAQHRVRTIRDLHNEIYKDEIEGSPV